MSRQARSQVLNVDLFMWPAPLCPVIRKHDGGFRPTGPFCFFGLVGFVLVSRGGVLGARDDRTRP